MTFTEIQDLKAERASHIDEARKINDTVLKRGKDKPGEGEFTVDEKKKYDDHVAEARRLKEVSDREEQLAGLDEGTQRQAQRPATPPAPGADDDEPNPAEQRGGLTPEQVEAFAKIFSDVRGVQLREEDSNRAAAMQSLRSGPLGKKEYRDAFSTMLRTGRATGGLIAAESRGHQADADIEGGYFLAPATMVAQLIKGLDNNVVIRQNATIFAGNYAGLGAVSLDTDVDDFDWTVELASGNETNARFGKRELKPHPLAKMVKYSKTLARTAPNVISIVNQRLRYKLGVTQEKAYLTGDGAGRPLGVMTASPLGIPTSRDVSTGNTATSIGIDGLKSAKWSMKAEHRRRARWLFHRDSIAQVDKLKDDNGQYLWQPSIVVGQPDRLLNLPVDESEYMPNTFTTGNYVGLLANWEYYWILDNLDIAIQVLIENYATTNQNALLARYEGDAMPVLAEAFTRVKLG